MQQLSVPAPQLSTEAQVVICSETAPVERIQYFKRYKMERALESLTAPTLPTGYAWAAWDESLIQAHSDVLCASFYQQIDAIVFSSLGDSIGCHCLITDLAQRSDFVPLSTWLLTCHGEPCGTIQGLHDRGDLGAIQNVGILPSHRGRGLGAMLVHQSLLGFQQAGLNRVMLEVTAENERAVQLYRRLGFTRKKTIYKSVVRKNSAQATPLWLEPVDAPSHS